MDADIERALEARLNAARIVSDGDVRAMKKWAKDVRAWSKMYQRSIFTQVLKDYQPAQVSTTDLYTLLFALSLSPSYTWKDYNPRSPSSRPTFYKGKEYDPSHYTLAANLLMGLVQTDTQRVEKTEIVADTALFFYPRRLVPHLKNALRFFMYDGEPRYNNEYGMVVGSFEGGYPAISYTDWPGTNRQVVWYPKTPGGGQFLDEMAMAPILGPTVAPHVAELFQREFCMVAITRREKPGPKSPPPKGYSSLGIALESAGLALVMYGKTQKPSPNDDEIDEIYREVCSDPEGRDDWSTPEVSEESAQRQNLANKLNSREISAVVAAPSPPPAKEPVESVYQSLPAEAMNKGIVLPPPPPEPAPVQLPPPPPAPAEPAQGVYQALPAEAIRPSPTPVYGPLPQDEVVAAEPPQETEAPAYGVLPERRRTDIYAPFPQDVEEEEILKLPAPKTLAEVKAFRKPWPGAETRIDQDILYAAVREANMGKIRSAPSRETELHLGKVLFAANKAYEERMAALPPMARASPDTRSEVYHQSLIAVNEPWGFTEACALQREYFERGTYADVVFDKLPSDYQPQALGYLSALGMLVIDQNTQGDLDAKDNSDKHATLGREFVAAVMDATVALTFVQYLPDSVNFRIILNDGGVDERVDIDPVLSGSAECLTMVVYESMEIDDWRYIESIGRQPNIFVEKNHALCVFWTRLFRDPNLVNELVNALARTCAENVMDVSPPQATAEEAVLFSAPASVAPVVAFSAPAVSVVKSKPGIPIASLPEDEEVGASAPKSPLEKRAELLAAGKTIAASAVVVPGEAVPKTKSKAAPKKTKSAPKRTRTTAKTEKQKAEEKAKKWWTNHPGGKTRDKNVTAKKVVTKAAEFEPSKNDFRGVDTKSKK